LNEADRFSHFVYLAIRTEKTYRLHQLARSSSPSAGPNELCSTFVDPASQGVVRAGIREAGSSSKLWQTFYRRKTEVLGMDLLEVGAEFDRCCHSARAILIEIPKNRQEMQFSAKDRLPQSSYAAEVRREGHPPNFVRPSIEEEHKFGGWVCQRWVPNLVVAATQHGRS
jgi:hypothetical protein